MHKVRMKRNGNFSLTFYHALTDTSVKVLKRSKILLQELAKKPPDCVLHCLSHFSDLPTVKNWA